MFRNSLRDTFRMLFVAFAIMAMLCGTVFASADKSEALPRLDAKNDSDTLSTKFRTFPELGASGSNQFSERNLQKIKEALPKDRDIIIVDLRQESHGFADGVGISWYKEHDWSNLGKDKDKIKSDEEKRLEKLQSTKLSLYEKSEADSGPEMIPSKIPPFIVNKVSTEKHLAKKLGMDYERFTVTDHRRPLDHDVDKFVEFARKVPSNAWLHFHCEGGKGRTTTFLAMYDMMKNAKTTSMEDILRRQHTAGGSDLLKVDNGWKAPYATERAAFIKKFYEYCRTNQDGFKTSWGDWMKHAK